jgi:hypothetical protein
MNYYFVIKTFIPSVKTVKSNGQHVNSVMNSTINREHCREQYDWPFDLTTLTYEKGFW